MKILVIDDDDLLLRATSRLLKNRGHEVWTALTGESGIMMFRMLEGVDAVLCDGELPGVDGSVVLVALRALVPKQPFVFYTGAPEVVASTAQHFGVQVLPKPATPDVIETALRAATAA